jgi:hypothetical protein
MNSASNPKNPFRRTSRNEHSTKRARAHAALLSVGRSDSAGGSGPRVENPPGESIVVTATLLIVAS